MKSNRKIKDKLKTINEIKRKDEDNSLFYCWSKLPEYIQKDFISWCEEYMQVSHAECYGGWAFGWSKYHEQYILFLKCK
ncbi:MAG: hypothetical protein WC976_06735 [Caldisericia bacterium]